MILRTAMVDFFFPLTAQLQPFACWHPAMRTLALARRIVKAFVRFPRTNALRYFGIFRIHSNKRKAKLIYPNNGYKNDNREL